MKKMILSIAIFTVAAFATYIRPKTFVIHAQTLPYTLTVAWDSGGPSDLSFNCYLDGVQVATNITLLTCSFPVATLGAHVAGVTGVNPSFVPSESVPATLAFTLQQPNKPLNIKVK